MAVAGNATIDYIEKNGLLNNVKTCGTHLHYALAGLRDLPLVGDVRGRGLLHGIEIVEDKKMKSPFPRTKKVSESIASEAARNGVVFLTGNAAADGVNGDTILIAPPFNVTIDQVEHIVEVLSSSICTVAKQLKIS